MNFAPILRSQILLREFEKEKNKERCGKTQAACHSFTLIYRAILSKPTQSAAGPGDAIQISLILKKKIPRLKRHKLLIMKSN